MARIPQDEIEKLKAEVSIERLAVAKGVKLKRHGKDLLGLCPFHDDKSAFSGTIRSLIPARPDQRFRADPISRSGTPDR